MAYAYRTHSDHIIYAVTPMQHHHVQSGILGEQFAYSMAADSLLQEAATQEPHGPLESHMPPQTSSLCYLVGGIADFWWFGQEADLGPLLPLCWLGSPTSSRAAQSGWVPPFGQAICRLGAVGSQPA